VQVHVHARAAQHPVLVEAGLPHAQHVAGVLQGGHVVVLALRVIDDQEHVDDRFCGQARHRRRPDVLDAKGAPAECFGDVVGVALEAQWPGGVVVSDHDVAPFWTAGRGSAHTYWVNTYDLPSRPLYNLPALTLHESAPGHSLQGALAEEQKEQPQFRSKNYISAYGEGWALYCEKLGKEMGIYHTAYEEFGRETYEMWRAARLVIDTGLHHKGWTREQAITYLATRTALSQHEVETEVDRYISWPGQALSYKLGEMKIVELRARAEKTLGTKFDLRAFHDAILAEGSVPLPLLEQRIDAWIASRKGA